MSDEQMSKFSALTKTTTSFPSPPPLETVVPVLKLPPHSPLPSSLGAVVPVTNLSPQVLSHPFSLGSSSSCTKTTASVTPSPLGAVVPVLFLIFQRYILFLHNAISCGILAECQTPALVQPAGSTP